ncbi:RDD family protein [Rhodocaloribacter sp.]
MSHVRIRTAQNVEIDFEVAGLGDRVLAAMIDYFLLICYVFALMILAGSFESQALLVVGALPYLLYFLVSEVFMNGQSIGKRIRRIKVVRLDGGRPTLGQYLLRWLLRFIDIDLTSGLAAVTTVLVTDTGQRLGDLAAGTTVVKVLPRIHLGDTLFTRLEDDYTPTFDDLDALTDADVETVREVLNTIRAEGRTPTANALGHKMKAALERKMGVTSDLPPVPFLRTVLKDYNYHRGRL